MSGTSLVGNDRTVTVRVPMTIRRRGGRKLVIAPDGAGVTAEHVTRHVDNAMVKAIARAHRWRRMLENGTYGTVAELAAAEKISQSYVCRILRLTLLAPDIVDAVLDGRQPAELMLANLMQSFPVGWHEQVEGWISASRISGRPSRHRDLRNAVTKQSLSFLI